MGLGHNPQRLVDQRRDLRGLPHRHRPLDERAHERHVVYLLERPLAPADLRRPAAKNQHGRVALAGGGDRAHPVGDAGPGGKRAHAGRARDLGPALGRERSGLLVAGVDQLNPLCLAAVVDREQMTAGEREQLGDPVGLQALGDESPAVNLGVNFGRH